MVNVVGFVVLAVHIEQHAGPNFALQQVFVEQLDPRRLDQEKIQSSFGAKPLDGVDEVIIRIQFVGHRQVINPRHEDDFGESGQGVNESCRFE
jgi:hypothetical protein